MQPLLASKYGLDLITNSKRLRDFRQGRKIDRAIDFHNGDLKDLIKVDERFHPIKNIDAAGRMLCDFYERTHDWNKALERYAGRGSYDAKVVNCVRKIRSPKFMGTVKKDFWRRNAAFKIAERRLGFDGYVNIFHQVNRNYGIDGYVNLPAYVVK